MPAQSSSLTWRSCVVAIVLSFAVPARSAWAAPKAPASDDTKRAGEAYKDGQTSFNLGQWDKAIEAWQEGYKLRPDPVFLYNIAQAYRKAGNLEQAIFFYKNFLRNAPSAPNRDEVSVVVNQLEQELAAERQRKADEAAKAADDKRRADEEARVREEERRRNEKLVVEAQKPPRALDGDIGIAAGVNLWVAGLHGAGVSPSAAVELSGGYTLVHHGRLAFRLGATVAFTYLPDLHSTVNFFGIMVDPTLKVDLWRNKLFFYVQVGLGAGILAGTSSNMPTYLLNNSTQAAKGAFASFEARPAVGIEYLIVPRLSVLLAPGAAITTPPASHFSTEARVQIIAGIQVHL